MTLCTKAKTLITIHPYRLTVKEKLMEVDSNRLLYDKDTLEDVRDGLEENDVPPKATEIKAAVDTSAFVYEIRTALTYWFGGRMDHRESERVWSNCEAIDNGEWGISPDNEIVYGDDAVLL